MAASRRIDAPIAAGFHQTLSLPPRSATTAWPRPTDRAPTGRRRKSAPSCARPVCARRSLASAARSARAPAIGIAPLERCRLIHEHDRNVVADRVLQPARMADEARLIGPILEFALALRADENRQQLRRQGHLPGSWVIRYPNRSRARKSRRQLARTLTHRSR